MTEPAEMADGSPGAAGGAAGGNRTVLAVPEMDCPSCAGAVKSALAGLDGVLGVEARPTTGRVEVTHDPSVTDESAVAGAVEDAGYPVAGTGATGADVDAPDPASVWRSGRAIRTWIGAAVLAAGLAVEFLLSGGNVELVGAFGRTVGLADALFLSAIAASGGAIFRGGLRSARGLRLDIDFLMSAAILGAIAASLLFAEPLYLEAATLSVLFSVAELLEEYSMDRARGSLRELMDLSPEEATVRREDTERTVPAGEVRTGDVVVVRPGEKIPVDGAVVEGDSAVDQAPITGESVPVDKTEGDEVYAGTIAKEGYLEIEATSPGGETTLSRLVELVEAAESNRTEREQFVQRFSRYYTPVVVGFAVLLALVPPLAFGAPWPTYVVYGLTLLVLACPCAFVISTPVSVVSGITSAARNGVLIKGGDHLEAMGAVGAVAFDKTGTLTKGELAVTDVVPLDGNTEADVLRRARGLERRSEHPIGEAIVDATDPDPERTVSEFESITGRGVRADLDDTTHYAGSPGLFRELGVDLSHVHAATDGGTVTTTSRELCERSGCLNLLDGLVPRLQAEGKTVVLVGTDERVEGVIAVADEVRPEAVDAVERLRERGLRTVMLTGDNERTARAIAGEVGIDEYRAELMPEGKVAAIEALAESGGVAMVGDGANDAPALATATVGIAMGAAGTDTALETGDVALLSDDLSKLPYLHDLSRAAVSVIRQNVWSSLAAKAILAALVPFGYVPIWLAVLAGDAGMTIGVTGNAARLSRIDPADN